MLTTRIAIGLGCVLVTTLLVYFERKGYRDADGTPLSLLDAAYYATVTLSTTGYGDIAPVSDVARATNIFIITPLRFLFLIVLVGTAIEALTKQAREERRREKWRRTVHDHTLIIGFGVKGRAAAQSLLDAGHPHERIVVVVSDVESSEDARRMGLATIIGDARRDDVLVDAGVNRASQIIVATNSDDTSVLVTLACRRLCREDTQIVSAARESTNADILRQSGANGVIVTAEAAGRLLTMKLISPNAGDLVEDLLDSSRGLELRERPVEPSEMRLSPLDLVNHGELVLAVIRDGKLIRFDDEHAVTVLQRDDQVVVVRQRPENGGMLG